MRLLWLFIYFVVSVWLVNGHTFRLKPKIASAEPAVTANCPRAANETTWAPDYKKLKLELTPPRRLKSRVDEMDEGYVRPAWGTLWVLMTIFVYIWIRTEFGARFVVSTM